MWQRKHWIIFITLLFVAAVFRISVAHWLPNDNPDDGRVYAQIARDVLEQHVYSHDAEPPYEPSLIRVPGYPLFIATVYSVFGHTNNRAVRIVQALIDTATCALVSLLAFLWQPDVRRKTTTTLIALAFAAVNPFTPIYCATILPEVPTMFLALATCAAASTALRCEPKRQIKFWFFTGLLAGMAVLFRPDMGLLAAAIGLTLIAGSLPMFRLRWRSATMMVAIFSLTFIVALVPWTIRNWRTFHLFQPLAPAHAEMPNEFIPHGYNRWLKTWLDDPQYIDPFEWELDVEPLNIDDLPDSAFDSDAERDRVAALFEKYNHPPAQTSANNPTPAQPQPGPSPGISPTPEDKSASAPTLPTPRPSAPQNSSSNSNQANAGAENDNSSDESDESEENENEANEANEKTTQHGPVEMTREIDADFALLAAERIARHPFRYYVLMPMKRARALWFNTHTDFYPFEGALFPLDDLDYETHQQFWLPLFALLVAIYTIAGIAGGFVLWASRDSYARRWLLMVGLIVLLRLGFLSTLENPEPRYVVEFFPFLAALSGIAVAHLFKRETDSSENTAQAS